MSVFENEFRRIVAKERSYQEAQDALETWFNQLSNSDYQAMEKGGKHEARIQAKIYLSNTDSDEDEDEKT